MNHPNVNDFPQGTFVQWSESYPQQIEIIAWRGYSPKVGEYQATLARFNIDKETKTIMLEHVSIKIPYSPWDETLTNPKHWVSDHMKRAVRAFMVEETGSSYWRVKL